MNDEPENTPIESFKQEVSNISVEIANAITDAADTDKGNYSASTRLSKKLRIVEGNIKHLRQTLRAARKTGL